MSLACSEISNGFQIKIQSWCHVTYRTLRDPRPWMGSDLIFSLSPPPSRMLQSCALPQICQALPIPRALVPAGVTISQAFLQENHTPSSFIQHQIWEPPLNIPSKSILSSSLLWFTPYPGSVQCTYHLTYIHTHSYVHISVCLSPSNMRAPIKAEPLCFVHWDAPRTYNSEWHIVGTNKYWKKRAQILRNFFTVICISGSKTNAPLSTT